MLGLASYVSSIDSMPPIYICTTQNGLGSMNSHTSY